MDKKYERFSEKSKKLLRKSDKLIEKNKKLIGENKKFYEDVNKELLIDEIGRKYKRNIRKYEPKEEKYSSN